MSFNRRDYNREYIRRRRAEGKDNNNQKILDRRAIIKQRAIESMGGECQVCHGKFDLVCYDFHHKDPTQKDITLANVLYKEWHDIESEFAKCMLLCANCHRVIHKNMKLQHRQAKDSQQMFLA